MVQAKLSLGLIKHQATNAYRIVSKAPLILNISNKMKVSGQLNIPATSFQRKGHPYGHESGWTQEPVETDVCFYQQFSLNSLAMQPLPSTWSDLTILYFSLIMTITLKQVQAIINEGFPQILWKNKDSFSLSPFLTLQFNYYHANQWIHSILLQSQ